MFAGTVQDQILDISRYSLAQIPLPVILSVSQEPPCDAMRLPTIHAQTVKNNS